MLPKCKHILILGISVFFALLFHTTSVLAAPYECGNLPDDPVICLRSAPTGADVTIFIGQNQGSSPGKTPVIFDPQGDTFLNFSKTGYVTSGTWVYSWQKGEVQQILTPQCNDGLKVPEEACDPSATPSGCATGTCNSNCSGCSGGTPSTPAPSPSPSPSPAPSSSSKYLTLNSNPQGADAWINNGVYNGKYLGKTPFDFDISADSAGRMPACGGNAACWIIFKKSGYMDAQGVINSGYNIYNINLNPISSSPSPSPSTPPSPSVAPSSPPGPSTSPSPSSPPGPSSPPAPNSSYTVNPKCFTGGLPNGSNVTCSNSVTINLTAEDKAVIVGANNFDDWGTLTVTKPSGATQYITIGDQSKFGPASIPAGTNIFNMFSEGPGTYTVTVWAQDTGGVGVEANALLTISSGPKCSLSVNPDALLSGETIDPIVSWTTSGAVSSTLDGTAVTPLSSGTKTFTGVNSAATYTLEATDSDGVKATCTAAIGVIVPPTGGLVPCGRLADNPATGDIDESKPCSLCAGFYLLKNIINFIVTLAIGIGVFILVIAGLLYAFSIGNSRRIQQAKSAITSALTGIAIIFIAWVVIAVILQGLGYANIATWNQVNCLI